MAMPRACRVQKKKIPLMFDKIYCLIKLCGCLLHFILINYVILFCLFELTYEIEIHFKHFKVFFLYNFLVKDIHD